MAKVCEEWFPMGSYKGQKTPGFYMDATTKANIDIAVKNATNDWDAIFPVTARGEVRFGKSVLGKQLGIYWTYQMWKVHGIALPYNCRENIVFRGSELIEKGNRLGQKYKFAVLDFDEAGADLETKKVMQKTTQAVTDFLRECGQYNLLMLLITPDFFSLPQGVATTRSNMLFDCFVTAGDDDIWIRGNYRVYSKNKKKWLYLKGKKTLDYDAVEEDFMGHFDNVYPVGVKVVDGKPLVYQTPEEFEAEYRQMKQDALKTREKRNQNEVRREIWLEALARFAHENGFSTTDISKGISEYSIVSVTHPTIVKLIQNNKKRNGEEEDAEITLESEDFDL